MPRISRRALLQTGAAAAGAGLVVWLAKPRGRGLSGDAFIRVAKGGGVTLVMPRVEMGQGTYTALTMLLAEELEVEPAAVRLEHAPADNERYANTLFGEQMTGGSTSVRSEYRRLREAGATARTLLVAAAASRWGVSPDSCRAEAGRVLHAVSGRSASYGELVDDAARVRRPSRVRLKDPKDFRLIGTHVPRLDGPEKVQGRATFGIDVRLPGMKFAAVRICPVFGGKVGKLNDAGRPPASVQVVALEDAVAVVSDDFWTAKRSLDALDISWDDGPHAGLSTGDVVQRLAAASQRTGAVARKVGDAPGALAAAARRVEAVYQVPFLAHATMEPVNCTAHVRPDGCDIWVGTQVPALARDHAARVLGLPRETVQVHNHLLGGGFGRRLETDFIERAVRVARAVKDPVQVIYTREEDIQHDMYRPYYYDRMAAGLDGFGFPVAWTHRVVGPSIIARYFPTSLKDFGRTRRVAAAAIRKDGLLKILSEQGSGVDSDAVDGASQPPYAFRSMLVDYVREEPPGIPTAWWRGVGATHNVFVVESFVDELAAAAGQDPFQYRRALLDHNPRALGVLTLAAQRAGWGRPMPGSRELRRGRGIALLQAFGSYVAQVAEVEVSREGVVRVPRVVCAVDCGVVVNPDTVAAQMQGGIVFGLSAALTGEITLKNGRVEQSNFHDYQVMRMGEAPAVEVHIVPSAEAPGGIGEPGTAAAMPALTNAIYAATGVRIRRPPVRDQLRG